MRVLFQTKTTLPVLLALFSIPTSGLSEPCPVCTPILRMTEARAACIAERQEEMVLQAEKSDVGVVFFNIDDCTFDGEEKRSVSEEMEGDPSPPAELDRTVILDAQRVECVVFMMEKNANELDPETYFDLAASCSGLE